MTSPIAERLKELRLSKHYTQSYVSSMLHLTRSSYSNYENGARTPPIEILIALAEFYGISMDALFGFPTVGKRGVMLTPEERCLLSLYRALTKENQKEMIAYAGFKKQCSSKSEQE